jgi:hypothetical protein
MCHSKVISQISYLKQHLSRNHQLPVYCPICKQIFSDETLRDAHAEEQMCQRRTDIKYEGVTTDQKRQLERRASPTAPEERQWFDIFDILFPGYRPRPTSAYINEELVAETENYQDFEHAEGPGTILEVLRQGGLSITAIQENHEHDIGVLRDNLLAEAFALLARRWHEGRLLLQGTGPPTDADVSSVIGTAPSTAGRTLVEAHDEGSIGVEVLLADKAIVEEGKSEETEPDPENTLAPVAVAVTVSTAAIFQTDWPQDQGLSDQGPGVLGSEENDVMELIDWSENDA